MNIGIIGQGFVGTAIREGLKNFYPIIVYDIKEDICPKENYQSLGDVVANCDMQGAGCMGMGCHLGCKLAHCHALLWWSFPSHR